MRWLLLAVLLVGCSSARPIMLPSGRTGYYVKCRMQEEKCYLRAAQMCPGGYRIIDQREYQQVNASATYGQGYGRATATQGFSHGRMLIECAPPDE